MSAAARMIDWAESGAAPDSAVRFGIRRLVRQRLAELRADDCEHAAAALESFVTAMGNSPVAPVPHLANTQHYELPEELFALALGPHRKYSCCYWPAGVDTLARGGARRPRRNLRARSARRRAAHPRARLRLGLADACSWRRATRRQPRSSRVTNSRSQCDYVTARAGAPRSP